MSVPVDLRADMAAAMMNALIEVCRSDGDASAYVDHEQAKHAMAMLLAMLMEADPAIRTRKDMREAVDEVAKLVRQQIQFMRERYEQTGARGWDAVPVTRN